MIIGIGICMLVVGLIGLVILQMVRKRSLEGFVFNNGAGCVENKCKLNKARLSEADYKEWCDQCDNCTWDETAKDCFPNPDYVPPSEEEDPSIDTTKDYCKAGCTNVTGEGRCNDCPNCVSCVNTGNTNHFSDNWCIPVNQFDEATCPGTDLELVREKRNGSPGDSSRNPNPQCAKPCDAISPGAKCDVCPSCHTTTKMGVSVCSNYDEGEATSPLDDEQEQEQQEDRRRREREDIDTADTMDYTAEESKETAKAKEKNKKSKFLRDFQSIVHNEVLNEQGMTTANSQEYLRDKARRRRHNMKPNQKRGCPDMSEYVRKDSIPCWGCTLE